MKLQRVLVAGVGLIGGSFALAVKQAGVADQVIGLGRSAATLQDALRRGVIDEIASSWSAVRTADLVLLAMPVGAMPQALAGLAAHLPPHCVVTDAGSTKGDVQKAARAALGAQLGQFVPAHPIAGAETSGVAAARAALFQGRQTVLTPLPENSANSIGLVTAIWQACGAVVRTMSAAQHDALFAAVSHLPHILAYALVHELGARDNADQLFEFAASGFRDFTRIAGSHPEMWRDICVANSAAVGRELDAYMLRLLELRAHIAAADGAALQQIFTSARARRAAWLESKVAEMEVSSG